MPRTVAADRPPPQPKKITHEVESVICHQGPITLHNHWIQTDGRGNTRCVYCKVSWADLDHELNGAR